MPSVDRLKQRLAHSLKARKLDAALGALRLLEAEQPKDPAWPRRAARLLRARSDRQGETAALRRALELQVDHGLVLDAIASCKALLALLPDDEQTLETLDLLYLEGTANGAETATFDGLDTRTLQSVPPPTSRRVRRARALAHCGAEDTPDEPLDALELSRVVPGARSVGIGGGEPGRIQEIPIDAHPSGASGEPLRGRCAAEADATEQEEVLDLRLEEVTNPELEDLLAAQRMCLPKRRVDPGKARGQRGESLRSELANVPLFGDLDPASLHTLIHRVRIVMLEAGQVLFRQGDPANTLYVVVDGAVVPIAEGERRRKLAVLERGEFFGEIGLVARQPRNATIEALVDSKLLAIDRRVMRELISRQPSVAKGILRFLRTRLIDRQMRTNLFFSAFVHAEREAVAKQFRFLEVQAGTPVVEQGLPPEGLFVVLSGALDVVERDTGKTLGELALGDVFGGLSLMDGRPAPADVVAREKCWLVVLGESRFRRILAANPRLERILRRLAQQGHRGPSRAAALKPI